MEHVRPDPFVKNDLQGARARLGVSSSAFRRWTVALGPVPHKQKSIVGEHSRARRKLVQRLRLAPFARLPRRLAASSESDWDTRSNSCTVLRSRLDRQLPSNQSQPLSHAGQPKSMPFYIVGIEPGSRITHDQLNLIRCPRQRYVALTHAAVLQYVMSGLLQHTKQAQ